MDLYRLTECFPEGKNTVYIIPLPGSVNTALKQNESIKLTAFLI